MHAFEINPAECRFKTYLATVEQHTLRSTGRNRLIDLGSAEEAQPDVLQPER